MPTSNGQVTGRDIRQSAIKTVHHVDENVTTAKLADLATTIEKTRDPLQISRSVSFANSDQTLTDTFQELAVASIDVPAWAGETTVMAEARTQVTVGASNRDLLMRLTLNSSVPNVDGPTAQKTIDANHNAEQNMVRMWSITAPGSTVTVRLWVRLASGTETSHHEFLQVVAWFQR